MILERSMHPDFLSNSYLVAGEAGGEAFFVDAGGPMKPLFDRVSELELTPTHILLTHHHFDHVSEIPLITGHWPDIEILISPLEKELVDDVTGTIEPGDSLTIGGLEVKFHAIPGHTAGMLAVEVSDGTGPSNVFTGDTLFKNSVGGVRAPGSTSYADLKHSVMDVLMGFPPETILRPGHIEETTVGEEWETNGFIRIWRGLDPEGTDSCKALGEPATLVFLGDDYDGGHKAWVRWPDGRDDIVPGSQVTVEA
jgi:glyoxylase-like metal-dependent hydrolase (beta-lactamase superfamily II)